MLGLIFTDKKVFWPVIFTVSINVMNDCFVRDSVAHYSLNYMDMRTRFSAICDNFCLITALS